MTDNRANLLDCTRDPTDDQLSGLMRTVAAEARAKASVARTELLTLMSEEAAKVRARYGLREQTLGDVACAAP